MQAMPSIVEADRRCHHASGDAQMGRLFPDDALVLDSFGCRLLVGRQGSALTRRGTLSPGPPFAFFFFVVLAGDRRLSVST